MKLIMLAPLWNHDTILFIDATDAWKQRRIVNFLISSKQIETSSITTKLQEIKDLKIEGITEIIDEAQS